MAATLAQVSADALTLPTEERIRLTHLLWDSVPEEEEAPLSAEWKAEIKRRIEAVDNGAETFSVEEVMAELSQKYP